MNRKRTTYGLEERAKIVRKKGVKDYLTDPRCIVTYSSYLAAKFAERWAYEGQSTYVIEGPLRAGIVGRKDVNVIATTEMSELGEFVRLREEAEPRWKKFGYKSEVERRFKSGSTCFFGTIEDQPAGVLFACSGKLKLDFVQSSLQLPSEVIGLFDVFTLPPYRGSHVFQSVYGAFASYFSTSGFKKVFVSIHPRNVVSLLAHNSVGVSHIFAEAKSWQRFGIRRVWLERRDQYVHDFLEDASSRDSKNERGYATPSVRS